MGFYAPAQLMRDARDHGVEVRPVDACVSCWDCTLERRAQRAKDDNEEQPALRLGLRLVKGLGEEAADRIVMARAQAQFTSVQDLTLRANLARRELESLADAARCGIVGKPSSHFLAGGRQRAGAAAGACAASRRGHAACSRRPPRGRTSPGLPHPGLTLGRHPLALLRAHLTATHIVTSAIWAICPMGAWYVWLASSRRASARRARVASCSSRSRTKPAT